jgi:hypothetical protein
VLVFEQIKVAKLHIFSLKLFCVLLEGLVDVVAIGAELIFSIEVQYSHLIGQIQIFLQGQSHNLGEILLNLGLRDGFRGIIRLQLPLLKLGIE